MARKRSYYSAFSQNPVLRQLATRGARYVGQSVASAAGRYLRRRLAERSGYAVRKSRIAASTARRPYPVPVPPPARPGRSGRAGANRGRGTYRTRGTVGPRFSRKISRKTNQFLTRGVVFKREFGATASDPNCVYVGHCSTPARQAIQAVAHAITRMFMLKAGESFSSYDAQLQGDQSAATASGYTWKFNYRVAVNGPVTLTSSASVAGETYAGFADRLLNLICATANTSTGYFEIVDIGVIDQGASGSLSNQFYSSDEIRLTIVGNSNMVIQNRTLANSVTADGDHDQADHVANNPLVGKRYSAVGSAFPYRFNNDFVAPSTMFQTDQDNGSLSIEVGTTLADLPVVMQNVLRKPPPYKTWNSVTGNWYERIEPGKIRRSKVIDSKTMTFAVFIEKFFNYLRSAATFAGVQQEQAHMAKIGKTNFFGFEKMCNSRVDEPSVSVGFEINNTLSCIATAHRRRFCAPIVEII